MQRIRNVLVIVVKSRQCEPLLCYEAQFCLFMQPLFCSPSKHSVNNLKQFYFCSRSCQHVLLSTTFPKDSPCLLEKFFADFMAMCFGVKSTLWHLKSHKCDKEKRKPWKYEEHLYQNRFISCYNNQNY